MPFKMNTSIVVVCAIVFQCAIVNTSIISSAEVPDYYWRDYFGIVPQDAIQGGTDQAGNPTYIGQVYIKNFELLPATIYTGSRYANTTAYGNELTTDKNIKILCSNDKDKLEWIVTKNEESHLLTNCNFIVGGTEIGHSLHIGRVNHGGRIIIGKIFSYPLPNRGLAIPYNGKPVVFQAYEILAYNCHKHTNSNSTTNTMRMDIDVRFSDV